MLPPAATPFDPQAGLLFAHMAQELGSQPEPLMKAILDANLSDAGIVPTISRYQQRTENTPRLYAAWTGGTLYYVMGGATLPQVQSLIDAYIGDLNSATVDPVNQYLEDAATALFNQQMSSGWPIPTSLWIAGYSFGGALAELIAAKYLAVASLVGRPKVITFGSPRPSNPSLRTRTIGSVDICRWMVDSDPVPLCPPHSDESTAAFIIYGTRRARRVDKFVHPLYGYSIDGDGVATQSELPRAASANVTLSIVNWLWGLESGDAANPHSMDVYVNRLGKAADAARPVRAPVRVPPEPVGHVTTAERVAMVDQHAVNVFNLERQQNAVPLVIPERWRVRAFRVGRVWYVGFGGQTIGTCGSKKKARQVARRLNLFLDTLQDSAGVDAVSLATQFQQYLADAQSATGGFSPAMNTHVP